MVWGVGLLFVLVSVIFVTLALKVSRQVNERLNQMNQSLMEANKIIGQNLGSATSVFGDVQKSLGKLEETNARIYEVGRNISTLQELLRAPKFRGQMGETMLENILNQVLPKEYFQMQYRFRSSDAVDAVIKLGEGLVPIDAKFSLENFQKFLEAQDEQTKNSFRKKFIQDIKNRIDEISTRYILPKENTYDFALMYIPAENVYYEVIIKEDMLSYCISKKVIPVSPNTFYAYLQVICLGLKGLKVEENAKEILKNLNMLTQDITKFQDDFQILGSHLGNARNKYEEAERKLERFSDRLTNVSDNKKLEAK